MKHIKDLVIFLVRGVKEKSVFSIMDKKYSDVTDSTTVFLHIRPGKSV